MSIQKAFQKFFQSDWAMAILLCIVFLLCNGYTYGWDDQHLEIPLLKSLINPQLYVGDYYVESLKKNFTSFVYPLLSKLISVDQIPDTYLILYLLSRYFLFFWIFKIWHLLAKDKFTAFISTLMIILLGRVEEFLYRTFSHQEFALAFILAGIYYFYKERFVLASAILGFAANFHALYSLFPFIYLFVYLVFLVRKYRIKTLLKCLAAFVFFALPFLIWTAQKYLKTSLPPSPEIFKDWLALYRIACPQNFVFYDKTLSEIFTSLQVFLEVSWQYWILVALYLLNISFNLKFRQDIKSQMAIGVGFGFLLISFFFSHVSPNRFILDLNLIRNTQFMLFILMGYTAILFSEISERETWLIILFSGVFFTLIRFGHYLPSLAVISWLCVLAISRTIARRKELDLRFKIIILSIAIPILLGCIYCIIKLFINQPFSKGSLIGLIATYLLMLFLSLVHFVIRSPRQQTFFKRCFILIPFLIAMIHFMFYHYRHLQIEKRGTGFWQLQRNWIDVQEFVKKNTPINSLLLVPHDMEMGGFRIGSERKVVVCYRDCGIIGFDYLAAVEWQNRLKDVGAFQVYITKPIETALSLAVLKYRVNYIVFMRYINPGNNSLLKPIYENEVFALYQVIPNPI